MKILAIDTSCDETSVAILDDLTVLSSVISSQVQLHKKWGGVVPSIARRAHSENIDKCTNEALKRAKLSFSEIKRIAVTQGPGLAIALEIGIQYAKKLSKEYNIPLTAQNHIEAHLFSSLLKNKNGNSVVKYNLENLFPALGIVLSGSHTDLILVKGIGKYKILGETLDDAVGESFDKVARMLNLGYPGGEIITSLAQKYRKNKTNVPVQINEIIKLPIPMEHSGDCNFSYSGLKTSCLYKINEIRSKFPDVKESVWSGYFCDQFLTVVSKSIIIKAKRALNNNPKIKSILVGGGVINNQVIMMSLSRLTKDFNVKFLYPQKRHRGDNAAMIGGIAFLKDSPTIKNLDDLDRNPSLPIK